MPVTENLEVVTIGQKLSVTVYSGEKEEAIVRAACKNKNNGQWYCATHDEGFENQFAKDTHIARGTHVLTWNCRQHGVEVP